MEISQIITNRVVRMMMANGLKPYEMSIEEYDIQYDEYYQKLVREEREKTLGGENKGTVWAFLDQKNMRV